MFKKVLIVGLSVGFLTIPSFIHAEVFKWIDDKGTIHFTDDYSRIPSFFQEQQKVEVKGDIQEGKTSLEPLQIIIKIKGEQDKTDPYQQEETWWRGKERLWKEQLEEASENKKISDKKFFEESGKLILRKFGSHQQFKSAILGLDRIREERTKYEDQIIKAEAMLEKLSRETRESGDDLKGWINMLIPLQPLSPETRKIERDLFGRDEGWWRQNVFEAKGNLEKAIRNYERTYEAYRQVVEKLDPSRFGGLSLTQYQMISLRLTTLNDQMMRDQDEISEAMDWLKKLSREAREAHADPAWLEWLD